MAKDYYDILGVPRTADAETIKKAFRKLAHQYHPDKGTGDEAKFKEINEAYQVLSNSEKRARYDQFGSADGPAGFGGQGFGGDWSQGAYNVSFDDLGDFVSSVFGGGFGGFGGGVQERRGNDLQLEARITLEEAFHGVTRHADLTTLVTCDTCSGSGATPHTELTTCTTCSGSGKERVTRNVIFTHIATTIPCRTCDATGKVPKSPCSTCKGSGRKKGSRSFSITIPAGARDGQVIKVAGYGEAGSRGTPTGDAYVQVRVALHKTFARHDDDLLVSGIRLEVADLLLGKTVSVPTITGERLDVTVAAGADLKTPYRVAGQGMPRAHGRGRGDLLVAFDVRAPKPVSERKRSELEKLL